MTPPPHTHSLPAPLNEIQTGASITFWFKPERLSYWLIISWLQAPYRCRSTWPCSTTFICSLSFTCSLFWLKYLTWGISICDEHLLLNSCSTAINGYALFSTCAQLLHKSMFFLSTLFQLLSFGWKLKATAQLLRTSVQLLISTKS